MCQHCRVNASGGESVLHGQRKTMIRDLAEKRVALLDSATLFEMSLDERIDLDTAIARLERKERVRLRNVSGDRLRVMFDEIE